MNKLRVKLSASGLVVTVKPAVSDWLVWEVLTVKAVAENGLEHELVKQLTKTKVNAISQIEKGNNYLGRAMIELAVKKADAFGVNLK